MKAMAIGAAVVLATLGAAYALWPESDGLQADPENRALVASGKAVYAAQCASCHGKRLEGQPEWRTRKADGRLPAPPHDETGHTWHHPDGVLFDIVKNGVGASLPTPYATDMPVFGPVLSDEEIWAVLAYIKSTWPESVLRRQTTVTQRAQ